MYGRQAKSISEQMGVSVKEANNVIKDFFKKFPKVAEYISYVQDMATERGYVLTATGHRCRIPDMMLPQYEFSYIDQSKSANFNPLSFGEQDVDENVVPEHLVEQYWNELDRAWGFKKKREIIERAEQQDGIKIVDNGGKISEAERQCLNSVIQGQFGLIAWCDHRGIIFLILPFFLNKFIQFSITFFNICLCQIFLMF